MRACVYTTFSTTFKTEEEEEEEEEEMQKREITQSNVSSRLHYTLFRSLNGLTPISLWPVFFSHDLFQLRQQQQQQKQQLEAKKEKRTKSGVRARNMSVSSSPGS